MSSSPKINLVENAAKFCNDLIKENVQIKKNDGDLNTVSEYNLKKWADPERPGESIFGEIFPKLQQFSNEYKSNMSGVSSYTVRAMLGDAAYHHAINSGTNKINWEGVGNKIIDYTTSFGRLQNIHDNHISEISLIKDDYKKLYCFFYKKVKELQELEPKQMELTGGMMRRGTRRTQGTLVTQGFEEQTAHQLVESIISSGAYNDKLPKDYTEEYKNDVIKEAKQLLLVGDEKILDFERKKDENGFYMTVEAATNMAIDRINEKSGFFNKF